MSVFVRARSRRGVSDPRAAGLLENGHAVPLSGSKQRALASLLPHANEVVSRDRLIDELWGAHLPAPPGRRSLPEDPAFREAMRAHMRWAVDT